MEVRDQAITVTNLNRTITYDYSNISNGKSIIVEGNETIIENNCHTASETGE